MKNKIAILLLILFFQNVFSQQGFQFDKNVKKIAIPFQLINNLIFIPIQVNGVELNFLLDTGVKETILFGLNDLEEINFKNSETIKMKGFGYNDFVDGIKSRNNRLIVNGFLDYNHEVYIVLDQSFNFSSQVGIPVNGIIGFNFFKNYLVETDYERKKIFVYKETEKIRKKIIKNYKSIDINIENGKPYIKVQVQLKERIIETKMLLDNGSSDAIWLFENQKNKIEIPEQNIDDYLGRGFSGDIFGKRSRIDKLKIDNFEFINPITSFPDSLSVKNSNLVNNREGSIGSEILMRFDIIYDYPNSKIYFKKNNKFNQPFNYNMSGIEIQHEGLQWVKEEEELKKNPFGTISFDLAEERVVNLKYKFSLKPIFKINSIRKNSTAEISGLQKDDIIIAINQKDTYKYSLQEINEILKSEDGKWIYITIERNNKIIKFKFQLKKLL